jgi:hypothetical protein
VDPHSGELFDRIDIGAQAIHHASLSLPDAGGIDIFGCADSRVLYQGASAELTTRIISSTGVRLVDESMTIEVLDTAATGEGTQVAWDRLQFAGTGDATSLQVEVHAGAGGTFLAEMPLAGAVDEIDVIFGSIDDMSPGTTGLVCFKGILDGDCVVGLPWELSVSGAGAMVDEPVDPAGVCVCVYFLAEQLGVIDIQASSLGVSHQLAIPVVLPSHLQPGSEPARPSSPSPFAWDIHGVAGAASRLGGPDPGDRAASVP